MSELFPVSSLGHIVLLPSLFGWHQVVAVQSDPESPWLAFVVMLHVGSALGLLLYFWRDWVAIIRAWLHTLVTRRIETANERLAWLIIVGTHPRRRHRRWRWNTRYAWRWPSPRPPPCSSS